MSGHNISRHLAKIAETSRMIVTYTETMDYEVFKNDLKTQDAVMMRLVSIAELINRLMDHAPDFIANTPHIPWNTIRGMRNKIAHDYFSIDIPVLFETAKNSIPQLIDMMGELLDQQTKRS